MADTTDSKKKGLLTGAAFSPFKERLFLTLWIAAFISNVGTWMQNVGVSWLAATLSASPFLISLIQTAASLPALLFSYPAGVISDHSDRRKLLLWLQGFLFFVVLALSVCAYLRLLDIRLLIFFTFLTGVGSALTTPVWQAITPEVISKKRMKEAIALNGVNFNLARAIGPALGGVILALWGVKAIFLCNAVSFLVLGWGIYVWHNTPSAFKALKFRETAREGLREVRKSIPFRHVLIRTVSFTFFVSIIFAFLPQLSKYEWKQTSGQYTWLWVGLGLGALLGSQVYSTMNRSLSPGRIVFVSCAIIAVCLFLLTRTSNFNLLVGIMVIAGIGWINATSTLNVLAQQYSPAALRGRFLAVNVTVFQGSIALSSAFWGYLTHWWSISVVMDIAALCMILFSAVLLLFPMEETSVVSENAVACTDPLLQYQLK
jgi:MFS family permease